MEVFQQALKLQPKNFLARFELAKSCYALAEYQLACEHLLKIIGRVPKEAHVHFLLGEVYRKCGDKHLAAKHFSEAAALERK